MEAKISHLQLIQEIVSRLASNSFLVKGWSVTLIAALFALAAKDANKSYILAAYFPAIAFWILDTFFLSQEKRFRKLYDYVRTLKPDEIDFSLNTEAFKSRNNNWFIVFFSKTILFFHGGVIITLIIVTLIL